MSMPDGQLIELVGHKYVAAMWPEVAHLISAGSADADYNAEHLRNFVLNGAGYLIVSRNSWNRITGAAVLEIQTYPNGRVAHVMAMAGRGICTPSMLRHLKSALKGWFEVNRIRCWAQPAQARLYRRLGLRDLATVMETEC